MRKQFLLLAFITLSALHVRAQDTSIERPIAAAADYFESLAQSKKKSLGAKRTIIRQVNVLKRNPNGKWKRFRTVILSGDKIIKMRSSIFPTAKRNATTILARHQYLTPGLIDMHMHHMCADRRLELMYLFNGITAAREMNGWTDQAKLRKLIRSNALLWPDYFLTSTQFQGLNIELSKGTLFEKFPFLRQLIPPPACDFHLISQRALEVEPERSFELANLAHKPIALEADWRLPIQNWLSRGNVYTLERLEGGHLMDQNGKQIVPTPDYREMLKHNVAIVPCLNAFPMSFTAYATEFISAPENAYVMDDARERWTNFYMNPMGVRDSLYNLINRSIALRKAITKAYLEQGGTILVGSETGPLDLPLSLPGFSFHKEMEALQSMGMTPRQVLDAATQDAAGVLDEGDHFGQVKKGMRADLLLLKSDPLLDIAATRDIRMVVLRGVVLDETDLTDMKKLSLNLR